MTEAYVETSILTDLLLKPLTKKQERAKAALARYDKTLLPVYSIKEWKAGPLVNYAYVHDKLVVTRSFAHTVRAVSELTRPHQKHTAVDALAAAATTANAERTAAGMSDEDDADRYRLALATLAIKSWRKRRKITTEVVGDLECYAEVAPRVGRNGLLDMEPTTCDPYQECCLAGRLKATPEILAALRKAVPQNSGRREDEKRRQALKRLIKHPKEPVGQKTCRDLGDAIFAFFCPEDAVILTTNTRDHGPLAESVGKKAEAP